jgi:hypothetical protein
MLEEIDIYEKLEKGCQLFIENSKLENYSIRAWNNKEENLIALLNREVLKMLGGI